MYFTGEPGTERSVLDITFACKYTVLRMIYLDWAATAPPNPEIQAARFYLLPAVRSNYEKW